MNKFRAGNNNLKTRSLFADGEKAGPGGWETDYSGALYWLYSKDDERPFMKDEFLKLKDPTGVKFANKFFEDWEHLQYLLKAKWFRECWDSWQSELEAILKQEALEVIRTIMMEGSTQSFAAAKFIATSEYKQEGKASTKRGRPSKEEVQGELKNAIKAASQTEEDYNRMMGLTVIQGGKATAHRG